MFEDFSSSGRGPGLVAMLLAILVLAGFGGMAMSVFYDGGGSKVTSLQAKVSDNKADIRIKKESLVGMEEKLGMYKGYQKLSTEVTSLERQIKQGQEEVEKLNADKATALGDAEDQKTAFIDYRAQYRLTERAGAKGEIIDLSTTHGANYKDVEILGISATLFRVRTSSGPKGVPFQELPPAVQDRFQFSENEAEEHIKNVAAANKVKNARIAKFQAAQAKVAKGKKAEQRVARIKAIEIELDKLSIIAKKKEDLASDYQSKAAQHLADDRAGRITGKRGMHKSLARQDQEKANRYKREVNEIQQKADNLAKELRELTSKLP